MKKCRGLALALVVCASFYLPSRAQTPPLDSIFVSSSSTTAKSATDATATITFGTNQSVAATVKGGLSERIGLQPSQVVDVAVQFSASKVAHAIVVEPLDGGKIVAGKNPLLVSAENTIKFSFQAGQNPGVYQICLHDGAQEIGLQFWVLDSQHPENNPPTVNGGN